MRLSFGNAAPGAGPASVQAGTAGGRRWPEQIPTLLIALALLWGLVALLRLVWGRSFNADELSHAHMAWLVSVGEVPYRDFAANHFPFLWFLLTPLMGLLPQDPGGLDVLRMLALAFNVAAMAALAALVCSRLPVRDRLWPIAAIALVGFSPQAMHFLIEFRPDPFANALLFCSLAWISIRPRQSLLVWAVCGLCVAGAILINTKYLAFPIVLGLVVLARQRGRLAESWPYGAALAAGAGAGFLCGALLLGWMRVSFESAWLWVVRYNSEAEHARIFGYGLASALAHEPIWLSFVVGGFVGYCALMVLRRQRPESFLLAAALVLALGLAATTRPWKQYVASWLLLGSVFPACVLAQWAARLGFHARCGLAAAIAAAVVVETTTAGIRDPNGNRLDRATQDRVMRWVLEQVPPDGYVVAGFPLHPVFRKDSFYKVVIDVTGMGDDGLERILPGLGSGALKERLSPAGYLQDLETRPPALIEAGRFYTPAQTEALKTFLGGAGGNYRTIRVPETELEVLLRSGPVPGGAQ